MRLAILTAGAMLAFATNSLLARLALAPALIDPLAYSGIRLVAGALVLGLILYLRRKGAGLGLAGPLIAGSWMEALSLLLYAVSFSAAYVLVPAGPGALILFACVQLGMLAWAVHRGDRPALLEWAGMAIAFGALLYLVSPGLVAPPLPGAILMAVAGLSWAVYCLLGRASQAPLADSAGNFLRAAPIGVLLIVAGLLRARPVLEGAAYALASGALASGLGYIVWYSALPQLSRTRAAFVQLTVPALAAVGGHILLQEAMTLRLVIAMAGILGGVAIALAASQWRRSPLPHPLKSRQRRRF